MASRMAGASFGAESTRAIRSSSRPGFRVMRTPTTSVPSGFLAMGTKAPLVKAAYVGCHRVGRPVDSRTFGRQGRTQQLAEQDRSPPVGMTASKRRRLGQVRSTLPRMAPSQAAFCSTDGWRDPLRRAKSSSSRSRPTGFKFSSSRRMPSSTSPDETGSDLPALNDVQVERVHTDVQYGDFGVHSALADMTFGVQQPIRIRPHRLRQGVQLLDQDGIFLPFYSEPMDAVLYWPRPAMTVFACSSS